MNNNTIGLLGLNNRNSVCYLNSLFQCLISCPSFVKRIEQTTSEMKYIINAYKKQEKEIVSKLINETNPKEEQQCVHETLTDIIDKYHLENIFEMIFTEIIICTICSKIIEKKRDKQIIFNHFEDKNLTSQIIEKSTSPVNGFYCPYCDKRTIIIIRRYLTEVPPILVICFNKFFQKDDISFPEHIKIYNTNYTLMADIHHIGNMNGGHYFSRVRRPVGNSYKYFQIDDDIIQEISDMKSTKNAYLLFYN